MTKFRLVLTAFLSVIFVAGCSNLTTPEATAFPLGYVATAIKLTIQAGQTGNQTSTPDATPAGFATVSPTPTSGENSPNIQGSSTPLEFNPTATASPNPSASSTIGPTNTPSRRATRTPTITPTPPIPNAGVQFAEPGPMSKVVSPLHLLANLRSVPSGTYRVELWVEPLREGEEPRPLYRKVERIISNPVDWVYLDQDIQFELSRVSEYGQLRVSVYDQYDRPVSINSVDLLLLSMGPSAITPSNIRTEPIVIREPTKNHLIQGGKVIVSGLVKPSEDFMLVELVAADGSVVGYRQVFVTPSPDGSYVPYSVEVPYQVKTGTWVRLRISESGIRITGIEHLSSVEVYLSP